MATTQTTPVLDVRADFPIFRREFGGRPLVYLDSAATSQKPVSVIEAIDDYYRAHNANIHRGVYTLAQEATNLFEAARARVAEFNGWETATTIFTRNATEAINLVAYAWGREHVGRGDVVLITQMEHHSNIVPWQLLCQEVGAELRYLDVSDDGKLSLDQLDEELSSGRVRLVGFAHISNVLGTINPVAEIAGRVRAAGAVSLVDGSQGVPQLPVDVGAVDADFYAWTGHKAVGPTGIGVLHGRREILEAMRPFLGGGDMISSVDFQTSTWNELPWKFEAGTSMVAEAVGLGAAVDYLNKIGMENVRAHELELTGYALGRLSEVGGVDVCGPATAEERGGVISFELEGVHPHDVAEIINRENVCVRAGHHCAMPLMRRLGVPATARASFGPYNETGDVDALIEALAKAKKVFA
jgi:cysteine desulfurase / selenocysteine lyase